MEASGRPGGKERGESWAQEQTLLFIQNPNTIDHVENLFAPAFPGPVFLFFTFQYHYLIQYLQKQDT